MSANTYWTIQIDRTEFHTVPDNENALKLPISILLNLPLDRCNVTQNPIEPIEIEEVRLYNRCKKEYVDQFTFERDDSAWKEDGECAWRTYACTLLIPNKNCYNDPIKKLEDALSLELYDTTSDHTPWFYELPQLLRTEMGSILITINH